MQDFGVDQATESAPSSLLTHCVVQAGNGQRNAGAPDVHSSRFPRSVAEHFDIGAAAHIGGHFVAEVAAKLVARRLYRLHSPFSDLIASLTTQPLNGSLSVLFSR